MKILEKVKEKRRYLAKAGYAAFPKTLKSIGRGKSTVGAIANDTGVPLFLVKAMVSLGKGATYVTTSRGKLVLTGDGKKRVRG